MSEMIPDHIEVSWEIRYIHSRMTVWWAPDGNVSLKSCIHYKEPVFSYKFCLLINVMFDNKYVDGKNSDKLL